jgi:SAM-dependent methyltransferase
MSLCSEYDRFAEYYDHAIPYRERPDLAFYVELARTSPGPVLDVGCGTGRVLLPCARAGATVVGIDVSEGMLALCRRKLAAEPPEVQARVTVLQGDMRDFDAGTRFALVIVPFRSFQHLETVADQRAALAVFRRHLAPGGRLVLDLFNPSLPLLGDERWLASPLIEPVVELPDGRKMVRSYRIVRRDFINQIQEVEFAHEITWPDGRVERHADTMRLRYLFRFEAEHLLVREGFEVDAVYADYDRNPYGSKYPGELIFVARAAARPSSPHWQ